ncbi:MAG TPA: MFS transporter [Acidimicrobiales bacterium]|nr:MFS transporter [Acidimicrobiales bacterium]
MATTAVPVSGVPQRGALARTLWYRQLDHYPDTAPRFLYLGIVVAATVLLYYQLYIAGAVAPSILVHYHMSFRYYVYISVVGNAIGAFSSLLAGLGDRWGRANMVTYGLLIVGLLILFGVPNAPNQFTFGLMLVLVGFVEGIILVATPALVRDFSPQLGRASAMGFWTLGPVVGSLCVAEVSSHTLPHLHAWQDQFTICGIVGLVVFVIALFGLRELSPNLRDQLMVSMHDRALIEARASGLDISESLKNPWRQMLHLDVVGSAFAIAVFLIIYYTAVGFFVIYFSTIFGFTEAQANGIGNWFWAFDAVALILIGLASDKLRVRKPFMIAGALGAVAMTIVFLTRTSAPHTGYYTFVWIVTLMSICLGIAYAPWMASFTETVEKRNPALTATGLAVWGWIIRAVVAISVFILPFVVNSMTPLVEYGAQAQAIAAKYPDQVKTLGEIDAATLKVLGSSNPIPALGKAESEVAAARNLASPNDALPYILALPKVPKADLAFLAAHGTQVVTAQKVTASQWRHWWWVCVGGEIVFIPLVFLMVGRWSPARARKDAEEHEAKVQAELRAMAGTTTAAV